MNDTKSARVLRCTPITGQQKRRVHLSRVHGAFLFCTEFYFIYTLRVGAFRADTNRAGFKMWQKIASIIAIVGAFSALALYSHSLSVRLEKAALRLTDAERAIDDARAQIEALRDLSTRSEKAHNVLYERIESGVGEYVQKMQSLGDDDACDWLNQRLPDVLRKAYECGNADRHASRGVVAALPEAGGTIDGD